MINNINELLKALEDKNLRDIKYDKAIFDDRENAVKIVELKDGEWQVQFLPMEVRRDREFIIPALKKNAWVYDHLEDEDKANEEYALIALETDETIFPEFYDYIEFTKEFLDKATDANSDWAGNLPDAYYEDGELMAELFRNVEEYMPYDNFLMTMWMSCYEDLDYMIPLVKFNWGIISEADESIQEELLEYVPEVFKDEAREMCGL